MQLPDDVCHLIYEYARPLTRGDWRKGSYIKRNNDNFDEDMNDYFNTLIKNEVPYVNYIVKTDGYMILNFKPTFKQMEKVFNKRRRKLVNFYYEKHEKTYIIRGDYVEMIYEN